MKNYYLVAITAAILHVAGVFALAYITNPTTAINVAGIAATVYAVLYAVIYFIINAYINADNPPELS